MDGLRDGEGDAAEKGASGEFRQDLEDVDAETGSGIPFATARFLKNRQICPEEAASSGEPDADGGAGEQGVEERQAETNDGRGGGSEEQGVGGGQGPDS